MLKVGLIQAAADTPEDNLALIDTGAQSAAECGCCCVCFSECSLTGYTPDNPARSAIGLDDPLLSAVSAVSRRFGLDVLVGFQERQGGQYYITHGIFRPDGSRDFYRKTHLGEKEAGVFTPGERLSVFSLSCGIKAGFQLCVETHFPEISRTLSLNGAQIIFAPHAVPTPLPQRKDIWQKIIPARCYDNRVYMLCCNRADNAGYPGGIFACDCAGEVLPAVPCAPEHPAIFEIDPHMALRYRADTGRRRYHLPFRRPELYD